MKKFILLFLCGSGINVYANNLPDNSMTKQEAQNIISENMYKADQIKQEIQQKYGIDISNQHSDCPWYCALIGLPACWAAGICHVSDSESATHNESGIY